MSPLQSLAFEIAQYLMMDIGIPRWPAVPASLSVMTEDNQLVHLLKPVMAKREFAHLKVGVVDLTNLEHPRFFLNKPHDTDTVTIGSTSKLAILYAAFQLREDLRNVLRLNGNISTLDELKQGLKVYWGSEDKPTALRTLANSAARWPRLERIFELQVFHDSTPTQLRFAGEHNCGIDNIDESLSTDQFNLVKALHDYHQLEYFGTTLAKWQGLLLNKDPQGQSFIPGIPVGFPMPFAKRLWLTCAWSDNVAATSCWKDIGAAYQNVLMKETGFYAVKAGKSQGLHCGATFVGAWDVKKGIHEIDSLSVPDSEKAVYRPYEEQSFGPGQFHSGTVATLLSFLTGLAQGKLISQDASVEMTSLLRILDYLYFRGHRISDHESLDPVANGSYFDFDGVDDIPFPFYDLKPEHGIDPKKSRYYDYWSKLGIAGNRFCDWAYVDFEGGPSEESSRRHAIGLVILNDTKDPFKNPRAPMLRCAYEIFTLLSKHT